jgi:23S rRNA (guanosine2251-2'-O)-methyltransferase
MIDICFGFNAIMQILKQEPKRITEILLQNGRNDSRINEIKQLAKAEKIKFKGVDKQLLNKLTSESHQGIIAKVSQLESLTAKDLFNILDNLDAKPLILILDGVTDPHNLGACLRTAAAVGAHAVVVPKDRSAWLTSTVIKVASGAAEIVPLIRVSNISQIIDKLKQAGLWIVGSVCNNQARSIYKTDMTCPLAIVVGSEDKGIRKLTQDKCDDLAFIPIADSVNSLNVSVATGVMLFEATRQRSVVTK